jgi:hypothetical protein
MQSDANVNGTEIKRRLTITICRDDQEQPTVELGFWGGWPHKFTPDEARMLAIDLNFAAGYAERSCQASVPVAEEKETCNPPQM